MEDAREKGRERGKERKSWQKVLAWADSSSSKRNTNAGYSGTYMVGNMAGDEGPARYERRGNPCYWDGVQYNTETTRPHEET